MWPTWKKTFPRGCKLLLESCGKCKDSRNILIIFLRSFIGISAMSWNLEVSGKIMFYWKNIKDSWNIFKFLQRFLNNPYYFSKKLYVNFCNVLESWGFWKIMFYGRNYNSFLKHLEVSAKILEKSVLLF